MKKASERLGLFFASLLILTFVLPVSAGVEPSPFKEFLNQIDAIEYNLNSIDRRLEHQISKLFRQDRYHIPNGTLRKLDAMAEKVCLLQEQLDKVLDNLPDDEKRNPEVTYELIDVELKARSIVNRIDKLFVNPDYIEIAPERVKTNSQIMVYIVTDYIRPGSICSGLSDTEMRTQSISIGDPEVEVDEDGFLCDPESWNEDVAIMLARTEGVEEMTEEHWHVMRYLRDYYVKFGVAPMIRKLCKETGFKLKKIYELFPSGPAKGACKVAGLPKPTGCV